MRIADPSNIARRAKLCAGFICVLTLLLGLLPHASMANENVAGHAHSIPVPSPEAADFLRLEDRLDEIALRVAMAADGQCANRWRHPGFKTHKLKDYPRSLRRELRNFAESDPDVLFVSHPDLVGQVRPRDRIIGSRGRPLEDSSQALQIQLALGRLNILRDGREITVTGNWPQLCYRPIHLTSSSAVKASTTPNGVELSLGLINYTRSDDELAYAIAHELSHFMLDHSRMLSQARDDGRLSPSFRRRLEMDADRGAVFLMHRAGYDVEGAVSFIDRSSLLRDFPLLGLSSHPRRSDRLADVRSAISELSRPDESAQTLASFVYGASSQ